MITEDYVSFETCLKWYDAYKGALLALDNIE